MFFLYLLSIFGIYAAGFLSGGFLLWALTARSNSRQCDANILRVLSAERRDFDPWWRFGENQEIIDLLKTKHPEIFDDSPWLYGWLKSHSEYFQALCDSYPESPHRDRAQDRKLNEGFSK